ncbi:MAG: hypothetical protein ACI9QL_004899 [Candidatus Omnitrophota bacterium]|jgi:hypothetical protein
MRFLSIFFTCLITQLVAVEPGWKDLDALGEGYVVWESNRTGQFRIWQRQLDGSSLKMLTPDDGEEHYAPHISPDGTRIAFYRYAAGTSVYSKKKNPVQGETALCLINRDGSGLKVLTQDARIAEAGGDRGVVWIDDNHLIFVTWIGAPAILNLSTGAVEILADTEEACLINASLTHAFKRVSFMPYDPTQRKVTPSKGLGGCEPYTSHDGNWGFWMGGAGGPVNRIHLRSGDVSEIVRKRDRAFPPERNYVYFPMTSRCGRLFTCAASPGREHDHFTSDYDVFVAATNPRSLELIGKPVRYSFDPATDRYPDVFQAPLELPMQVGEAPYVAQFNAEGNWSWNFGDGGSGQGPSVQHVYQSAGVYQVRGQLDGRIMHGQVIIESAAVPEVLSVLIHGTHEIEVIFDEAVQLVEPKALLEPPANITATRYGHDHHSLIFTVDRVIPSHARLYIEGIQDMMPKPNTLDPMWLDLRPLSWPVDLKGLVYVFQTADQANKVQLADGTIVTYPMSSRGQGRLDHDYAMVLDHGSYRVEGAGEGMLAECRASGELSIEMVVTPRIHAVSGPARIISYSKSERDLNFSLSQEDAMLVLRLRTSESGNTDEGMRFELCPLNIGTAQHILISYRDGQLTVYKHGTLIRSGDELRGTFESWEPMPLVFGDDLEGHHDWSGTLEGVAIYNRFIEAGEAMQTFQQYYAIHKSRAKISKIELDVTLVGKSTIPTLDEISPYREGLGMFKYKVNAVHSGNFSDKEIYIAHWLILDDETLSIANRKPGDRLRLKVERFEDNPQLKSFFCRNDFNDGDALFADHYFAIP